VTNIPTELLAILGTLTSYLVMGLGWSLLSTARVAVHWPRASGVVTARSCEAGESGRHPDCQVTYSVNGTQYVSRSMFLGLGRAITSRKNALDFLRTHPLGSTLDVHYDPLDPARSYLYVGEPVWAYLTFGFGILLNASSVGCALAPYF